MRHVFTRTWLEKWALPKAAAGVAIGVVLAAPLASPNRASAKVEISGATSLSDTVSVTYAVKPPKVEKPDKPSTPEPAAVAEQATASVPPAGSIHANAVSQVAGSVPAAGSVQAAASGQASAAVQAAASGPQSVQAATSVQAAASDKPDKPEKPEKPEKPPKAGTTDIHLLAFNDLHGNLQPASLNIYGKYAGGAAFLAKAIKDRQAMYGDLQATVFAGDNIGASPLENGLFHEEPITIASNLMGVDIASVGNHEFDKGSAELRRIQRGGCHPVDGCTGAPYALPNGAKTNVYPGADFQYLSTNVVMDATGRTLFPAFATETFTAPSGHPIRIGFLGEVLESTPTIVTPTGVAGLTFEDEADAANEIVRDKRNKTVGTWVLVIHEGGFQTSPAALNGCTGQLAGSPIADIATRLDPRIKVIVSAHTHAEYRCTITTGNVTRLITSASSFGRILTDITLKIDDKSGQLVQASAENIIVENATNAPPAARVGDPTKADPQVQAVVNQYVTASAPLANQVIGTIQADLSRTGNAVGESALGDVIADAQLAATAPAGFGNAVIAFMNPGGIRADLVFNQSSGGEPAGEVT
jgi:5'-nucleotidase